MKVAVMGRSLRGRMSGVVRYTHELVTALAGRMPDDLTVFVTRPVSAVVLLCSLFMVVWPAMRAGRVRRRAAAVAREPTALIPRD